MRNLMTPNQTAKMILTLDKVSPFLSTLTVPQEKEMSLYPDTMWNQLCQIDDVTSSPF